MTIKEIRAKTGLSQIRFAEKYNIPRRTLEAWESGNREPADYLVELLWRAVKEDFQIKIKEEKEMRYIVIAEKNGDMWNDEFESKEVAIKKAERDWKHLSAFDKKNQTITVLESADPDEESEYHFDGDPIWENGQLIDDEA